MWQSPVWLCSLAGDLCSVDALLRDMEKETGPSSVTRSGGSWARLRAPESRLLLSGLAVCGAISGFLALADEVREGGTAKIDQAILLVFRGAGDASLPLGPRWLQETQRDLTALGGFTVLTLISLFAAILLLIHGRRLQALIYLGAVIAAQGLSEGIKAFVARPRPDLVAHLDLTYSSSFPSGHATMAPVVYLTLAAILCAGMKRRAAKAVIIGGAVCLVVAIGVSRVYLGVHWPSDVLGGWALGCAVALMAEWTLHRNAPHRPQGEVAPDAAPAP